MPGDATLHIGQALFLKQQIDKGNDNLKQLIMTL